MQKKYTKHWVFLGLLFLVVSLSASHNQADHVACECAKPVYISKLLEIRLGESLDEYSARISRNILKTKVQKRMYICNWHLWALRRVASTHECQPQVLAHIDSRLI